MGNILLGLSQLASPSVFLMLFLGVALGLTVGALPGLNDSITIAVLIPVTFVYAGTVGVRSFSRCLCIICLWWFYPGCSVRNPWYSFCNGNSRRRI